MASTKLNKVTFVALLVCFILIASYVGVAAATRCVAAIGAKAWVATSGIVSIKSVTASIIAAVK
nr:hypothetical protein Itr_chr13CG21700 [Ipomoea trifida]GMD81459.1 hypothetical protein Iba_chr13eCG11820 [Ipomoea batatas]GMD82882.1 hypothetical protein Iba_chr13fCG12260 [Ipomoea batatas]